MQITRISPVSHTQRTVHMNISHEQLRQWRDGQPFNRVFKNLSAAERVFFLTGMTLKEARDVHLPYDHTDITV